MQNLKTSSSKLNNILTVLFKEHESAEYAYQALLDKGYKKEEIHLLMSDETRKKYFPHIENATNINKDNKSLEGIGAGSAIGGTIGAIAAAILTMGSSLLIPALGIVVSGPLAAAMAGGGVGAFTGGLVGGLVGAGIPSDKAKLYEVGIKSGGIVIGVNPHSKEDASAIEAKWKELRGDTLLSNS